MASVAAGGGAPWPLSCALAIVGVVGLRETAAPSAPAESFLQLTDFNDSAAMPSLSADGRMLTFIRGVDFGRTAPTQGQVYVKLLPSGRTCAALARSGRWVSDLQPRREPHRLHRCNARFPMGLVGGTGAWRLTTTVSAKCLRPDMAQRMGPGGPSIKSGTHMGIVASSPLRTERGIPLSGERGRHGASFRALPRRRFVARRRDGPEDLAALPARAGGWVVCRTAGGTAPRAVHQRGVVTGRPLDGTSRRMPAGLYHIWRQRYPDGTPEQITVGPTEQEGTAITLDGQHLITSMGLHRAAVWLHD